MPQRLRNFSYLDSDATASYLSDLLGGLPEASSFTDRSGKNRSVGFGVGFKGTGINAGSDKDSSAEDTENLRHTPESLFRRFYDEVSLSEDKESLLVNVEKIDDDLWKSLGVGDILEVQCHLRIPEITKALLAARELNKALPFLDALGESVGDDLGLSKDDRQMLSGFSDLQSLRDSAESQAIELVLLLPIESRRHKLVAKIKRAYLRRDLEEIGDQVTVVCIIQRKLKSSDPPLELDQLVPGLDKLRGFAAPKMNREQRRAAKKSKSQDIGSNNSVAYPAAVIEPIAIY